MAQTGVLQRGWREALARSSRDQVVVPVPGQLLLTASVLERLCSLARELDACGHRLAVVCGDEEVCRLLTLTGFARRFEILRAGQSGAETAAVA